MNCEEPSSYPRDKTSVKSFQHLHWNCPTNLTNSYIDAEEFHEL